MLQCVTRRTRCFIVVHGRLNFSPRRRFVFQAEISGKYIVLVLISLLFYFFSSRRRARGDQCTVFCIVSITSHCLGKEPALLPEPTVGLVDLSIVNFDQ